MRLDFFMKKQFEYFQTNKKLTLFFAILWSAIIFIGCSLPGNEIPKLGMFKHFDKIVHFTFFALFFLLWFFVGKINIHRAIGLILLSLLIGFVIEFYQMYFVAGRSFDVWDGVADTVGALGGYIFFRIFK